MRRSKQPGIFKHPESIIDYTIAFAARLIMPEQGRPVKTFHWKDPLSKTEQTVFGTAQPGLTYEYYDRLNDFNPKKFGEAFKNADKSKHLRWSPLWFSKLMTDFNGYPTQVEHIKTSCNAASGNRIYVVGYRSSQKTL